MRGLAAVQQVLLGSYSPVQVAYKHILGAQEMCAYKEMCS